MRARSFVPRAVTFDCWQTLIYEQKDAAGGPMEQRLAHLAERTGAPLPRVREAFADAWREHQRAWHRLGMLGGPEITAQVLKALGVELAPAAQAELVRELEDVMLRQEVCAIEGTHDLLSSLRASGVRTALICDTGFTPGRVVRRLLERVGLLEHLELQVFSDELRVPKPHPLAFRTALEGFCVPAAHAVHIGDLRRSDIAGARAAGMRSIRFAGRSDDSGNRTGVGVIDCRAAGCEPACAQPEADHVATSYAQVTDVLCEPP